MRRERELAMAADETKQKAETEPTDEQAGREVGTVADVVEVVISRL